MSHPGVSDSPNNQVGGVSTVNDWVIVEKTASPKINDVDNGGQTIDSMAQEKSSSKDFGASILVLSASQHDVVDTPNNNPKHDHMSGLIKGSTRFAKYKFKPANILVSSRFDISPNRLAAKLEDDDVFGPAPSKPLLVNFGGREATLPPPLAPSAKLDPRIEPQVLSLKRLDIKHDHPLMCDPSVDDDPPESDGLTHKQLRNYRHEKINNHLAKRVDYIRLASRRFNQMIGLQNDRPFVPPVPVEVASHSRVAHRGKNKVHSLLRANMPPDLNLVDVKTGKGLREYMLALSKHYNGRKTECLSITFQDFTIDMKTHRPLNKSLAHFESEGARQKIDAWEVSVPVSDHSEDGEKTSVNKTWLWILISRPLISSFSPDETRTKPSIPEIGAPPTPPPVLRSVNDHALLSQYPLATQPESDFDHCSLMRQAPFAFPNPMPVSWVVFALPLDNAGSHKVVEDIDPTISPPPDAVTQKRILRRDFDMSHHGVPLFEYSNVTHPVEVCFVDQNRPMDLGRMVSVENMGEYWEGYEEEWWGCFAERVEGEEERWASIERCMSRGACRVVLRWETFAKTSSGSGISSANISQLGRGVDTSTCRTRSQRYNTALNSGLGQATSGTERVVNWLKDQGVQGEVDVDKEVCNASTVDADKEDDDDDSETVILVQERQRAGKRQRKS